jgi:methylated-DNA-[protein]-cysteine S-methyltransferase
VIETPIGVITLVGDGEALTGLYFPGHWYMPPVSTFGPQVAAEADVVFSAAATQLGEYLLGERTSFDLPTSSRGDTFQEQVWALLADIPFGTTTTYGDLAARLGDTSLAQQVGKAVGHNPLCIIVPCHRVVGKNGNLTGYAGGLKRKQFLLELEQPAGARSHGSVQPSLPSSHTEISRFDAQ